MSQKRKLTDLEVSSSESAEAEALFRSSSIEDRASTFVAIFSPTLTSKDLQKLSEFQSASHRMVAWRKASTQQTLSGKGRPVFIVGSDDDGEKYGGKRLEKVLNELDVEGSVVCARWYVVRGRFPLMPSLITYKRHDRYGGVLLGPVRFNHIEVTAREAILQYKSGKVDASNKKVKMGSNISQAEEKASLVKQLLERDESIVVLRKLLADKNATSTKSTPEATEHQDRPPASPVKKPNYTDLPVERLRQLDKARDATIAWILKQIDTVESTSIKPNENSKS